MNSDWMTRVIVIFQWGFYCTQTPFRKVSSGEILIPINVRWDGLLTCRRHSDVIWTEGVLTFFAVWKWLICFRTRLKTYPVECRDLLRRARVAFQAGRTLNESFRLTQLEAVVRMLGEHEGDFVDALGRDLHKVSVYVSCDCSSLTFVSHTNVITGHNGIVKPALIY